jgi:fimbrial isopeptide formation D2 family protein
MKLHISGLLAACCLAGMSIFHAPCAYADVTGQPVIDTSAPVSLTIHKYENNDAYQVIGNGYVQTVPGTPMEGIEYSVCRIGSWTAAGDESEAGSYFTDLPADFLKLLSDEGAELTSRTVGGVSVFLPEDTQSALQRANAAAGEIPGAVLLMDFVREHREASGKTGADGTLQLTDLEQGVYLVAETDTSGLHQREGAEALTSVLAGSEPFLVTLPMTSQTEISGRPAGTQWQYEVHVYPKNATVSIPKYIVDEGGEALLTADDRAIGQDAVQILAPLVPAVRENQAYETYIVTDTMDAGLSFVSVDSVKLGSFVADPKGMSSFSGFRELEKDDYIVEGTPGSQSFRVILSQTGLAALNSVKTESQLLITFTGRLNGAAPAGTGEKTANTPELTFQTKDTVRSSVRGNTPVLYTYALELTKTGLSDGSLAAFTVAQADTPITFTRESDGVYHVTDITASETGENQVHPDKAGKLLLKGFDSKTYTFTETETETGWSLLKEPFDIVFSGNDPADGRLKAAELVTGGQRNSLAVTDGTARCTVHNDKAAILYTGGRGRLAFTVCGGAVLLISLLLMVRGTRTERRR